MPAWGLPLMPCELAQAELDVQAFMTSTCNVMRPTGQTSDGAGGNNEGYTTVYTALICMAYPARALSSLADDIQQNEQGKVIGQWIIQVPAGTAIQKRDRITLIDTGRVYEAVTTDVGTIFSPAVSIKASLVE